MTTRLVASSVPPASTPQIRENIVDAVKLELLGPWEGHPLQDEILPIRDRPSRFYITGYLVPQEIATQFRPDAKMDDEENDEGHEKKNGDSHSENTESYPDIYDDATEQDLFSEDFDDDSSEKPIGHISALKPSYLPSSVGLSVILPAQADDLVIHVGWGEYTKIFHPQKKETAWGWRRQQRRARLTIPAGRLQQHRHIQSYDLDLDTTYTRNDVPHDAATAHETIQKTGLRIQIRAQPVDAVASQRLGLPIGARSVDVFLLNTRSVVRSETKPAVPAVEAEELIIFHVEMSLCCAAGFIPRADTHAQIFDDSDARIADLHYRDVYEYAVGHGIATESICTDNACYEVKTAWIPRAYVHKVAPAANVGAVLSMDALAAATEAGDLQKLLGALPIQYTAWIAAQEKQALHDVNTQITKTKQRDTAKELLDKCRLTCQRMQEGIRLIDGDTLHSQMIRRAFCWMNEVMARAARQRHVSSGNTSEINPTWRPFQLAFILMNLAGIVDKNHADREAVDLLFFPTGGGKTEAYLGLAAFTIFYRRLRHAAENTKNKKNKNAGFGMSVLMRYTLRLLTLDQLSRAATLICAMELLRQELASETDEHADGLGNWPFEIGLWVGAGTTPNRLVSDKPQDNQTAAQRLKRKEIPIPLGNCPWCGEKLTLDSFTLCPPQKPTRLDVKCVNSSCDFTGDNPLPIVAVDEVIYRRLPCFMIATVDKIASLPWLANAGKLFGNVTHYDAPAYGKENTSYTAGFYHQMHANVGDTPARTAVSCQISPPDLIIQDELHLISGPLGTVAGLYEVAVEAMAQKPKIIASTATVKRATAQVQALFGRTRVEVFPPAGPNRHTSFFAETVFDTEKTPPRAYVGINVAGRNLKETLLRTYIAILAAAERQWQLYGTLADPYMTLLGYFNSLRELGVSRRLIEDEVVKRLNRFGQERRLVSHTSQEEQDTQTTHPIYVAARTIAHQAVELTSRVKTEDIADAKRRLAVPFQMSKNNKIHPQTKTSVFAHKKDESLDVVLATNMISVGLDVTRLGLMVVLGQPLTTAEYIQATSRVGRDDAKPGLVFTIYNVYRARDRSHYERFAAYHETFYRSVEATSITPFAPRALDRALAPSLVAAVRHTMRRADQPISEPFGASLLQEEAFYQQVLTTAKSLFMQRAHLANLHINPKAATVAEQRVEQRITMLLEKWRDYARQTQKESAGLLYHRGEVTSTKAGQPLLHTIFDPNLRDEPEDSPLRAFCSEWSLRDVEPEVEILVKKLRA